MATIEERAKMQARLLTCKNCTVCKYKMFISDLSENICSLEGDEACEENYAALQAYIQGATEQREIDEEMFCMFLNSLRESNAWEGREWRFTRLWSEYKSKMEE